jgi:hypothetical protein
MGCLRRIGCLVVIILAVAVGFAMRDFWRGRERTAPAPRAAAAAAVSWELMTPDGAARAQAQLDALVKPVGPVFVNIAPGDLAALVFKALAAQLPASAEATTAAVIGEKLFVRGSVQWRDFGPDQPPSVLDGMLGKRTAVEFGGTLDIVHPGLAQYRVRTLKVGDVEIPAAAIPQVLDHLARSRATGMAPDAMPFVVPRFIADVRVHGGKVTVYRSGP